ncbi:MAG: hypothetical protein LC131_07290 [Anaerolineae bacterium]|nr:hypothetical protein [Anaerolineae bacterium]
MQQTYLTTEELSSRIKYDPRTIRERLKDSVLLEGVHYIRTAPSRRKAISSARRSDRPVCRAIQANAPRSCSAGEPLARSRPIHSSSMAPSKGLGRE